MTESYSFNRTYKYHNKDDSNLFSVKYQLSPEYKGFIEVQPKNDMQYVAKDIEVKEQERKKSQLIDQEVKRHSHHEKNRKGKNKRQYIDYNQFEELKKYQSINLKHVKPRKEEEYEVKEEHKRKQKVKYRQIENKDKKKDFKRKNNLKSEQLMLDQMILRSKRSKSQEKEKKINISKPNQSYDIQKKKGKKIYEQYKSIKEIEESRARGEKKYYFGRVQFSEKIKWFAKIISSEVEGRLQAEGSNRNRSIHEDEVYFTILKQQKQKFLCKIVAIKQKNKKRQFVGKVDYLGFKKMYTLQPINKRIISMNIRLNQLEKGWKSSIANKYFLAQYTGWNSCSQYPECKVISEYGQFGQVDVETRALLKTHDVIDREYTEEEIQDGLMKFIVQTDSKGQYIIDKEQIAKRSDLREERIFTIDPLTARDFDDALSINQIQDTSEENYLKRKVYQIGVHIADASFFVEQGSTIDQQAQMRTTSVYLMHRVIPMLPRVLCQTMCSLNPGVPRLTLSVWFKVDEQGNILESCRFDRSVIRSKARFTYEQAQQIIDGTDDILSYGQGFGCTNKDEYVEIRKDVIMMNTLANKIRQKRIERGSLIFQVPKKGFKLDQKFYPISFQIKQRSASNFLVEEMMLLANQKVGQIIVKNLKQQALLRRHKFPGQKKIKMFEDFMKKIGFPLKVGKQTKVQHFVNQIIERKDVKQCVKDVIKYEMIGLLEAADYFRSGTTKAEDWIHYALNIPVYTHFTSPIRRYPDIIVHRQLIEIIESNKKNTQPKIDQKKLNILIERCNKNKMMAKKVSNACEKVFMCLYLKDKLQYSNAILANLQEWGVRLAIPKYDIRTIIRFKDLQKTKLIKFGQDSQGKKYAKVEFSQGKLSAKNILREMQEIEIAISSTDTFPIDYKINIIIPHPEEEKSHILLE